VLDFERTWWTLDEPRDQVIRARFACTPTAWRKSKHDQLARKTGQAPRFDPPKNGGQSKQEIKTRRRPN